MEVSQIYERWLEKARDDEDLIKELESLKGNDNEIYERFYGDLTFGTAGLRGVIGAGTYRMNIYTVRRATQGLANYLNKKYPKASVAISHDSRIKARLFAMQAAAVLAANNIKVYISKELQPTPVLSYAVRELSCQSGIMITASHNPAKYNGYKCYGSDGCQMTDNDAESVYNEIQSVDYFENVKIIDFDTAVEQGKIEYINDELYERYLDDVQKQTVLKDICKDAGLSVVYTPLNGAGNKLIRKIMDRIGVDNVTVVKEQELPDGNFSTCPYPNPEFKEALELGLKLCDEIKPDLLIASDPDSDRVGIAVKDNSSYRLLSGNETGVMLTQYILSNRKRLGTLPQNPILVKTIVTSVLTNRLAEEYGCELKDVLTGFKYIGEQILSLEQKGEQNRFVFGFEESYGYLAGTYVRDKDAVVASMLICEMAAYYKKQGLTLAQVIDNIYEKYGYYMNKTYNYSFEGAAGMEHMSEIMNELRKSDVKEIAGYKLNRFADFKAHISYNMITGEKTTIALPTSDVLLFALDGGNQAIVRPSGTEPKIKLYVTSVGKDETEAAVVGENLKNSMMSLMNIEQ
ncbi:MAG: phospho-sugar mutase [Acutalibacteraceae bacterium]